MINILIFDSEKTDIMQTNFNGTIEDAKEYYKKSVVLSSENTIYKIIQYLILKGVKVKYLGGTFFKINLTEEKNIEVTAEDLHNIGFLTGIYKINNIEISLYKKHNINTCNGILNFFNIPIEKNILELYKNINVKKYIEKSTKWKNICTTAEMTTENSLTDVKVFHDSGLYYISYQEKYCNGEKGEIYQ